jgi:hypothetical protein
MSLSNAKDLADFAAASQPIFLQNQKGRVKIRPAVCRQPAVSPQKLPSHNGLRLLWHMVWRCLTARN